MDPRRRLAQNVCSTLPVRLPPRWGCLWKMRLPQERLTLRIDNPTTTTIKISSVLSIRDHT